MSKRITAGTPLDAVGILKNRAYLLYIAHRPKAGEQVAATLNHVLASKSQRGMNYHPPGVPEVSDDPGLHDADLFMIHHSTRVTCLGNWRCCWDFIGGSRVESQLAARRRTILGARKYGHWMSSLLSCSSFMQ